MRKTLSTLAIFCMIFSSCSENNNPSSGDFYVQATINPSLDDQRWYVGNETTAAIESGGNLLKTDPLRVKSGENISLVTGIIEATDQCHSITLDLYYAGKKFDTRVFEIEGLLGVNLFQGSKCKDGYEKPFNVIIPE
jgi:hypothetical protein